jgi:hypothetical protein
MKIIRRLINGLTSKEGAINRMDFSGDKVKVPIRIKTMRVQPGLYYNCVDIWFTIGDHPKEFYVETTETEKLAFNKYKMGQSVKIQDIEQIAIAEAVERIVINFIIPRYKKKDVEIIFDTHTIEKDTDKVASFDWSL